MKVDLPIPVVVTRHQCPHCRITRAKKAAMVAHIARCWRNPAARACKTCANFEPPEPGPYDEHPGWPEGCAAGYRIDHRLKADCPSWQPTNYPAPRAVVTAAAHPRTNRKEQHVSSNAESILIALFSVAHTPEQAQHAAKEVTRQHAHELAEQQRAHFGVGGTPPRAHCDPNCDFCRGVIEAADLIDPEVQS